MIAHQRDKYSWQFVFLGANQDAIATASAMNVAASNAITYAHSPRGTRRAFAATSANLFSMRCGLAPDMGYSSAQREEQHDAGA